jgi:hypothetical protein
MKCDSKISIKLLAFITLVAARYKVILLAFSSEGLSTNTAPVPLVKWLAHMYL